MIVSADVICFIFSPVILFIFSQSCNVRKYNPAVAAIDKLQITKVLDTGDQLVGSRLGFIRGAHPVKKLQRNFAQFSEHRNFN